MAMTNLKSWSEVWKQVRKIDYDYNGLIASTDLEVLLRDMFPDLLEGKSVTNLLRAYRVAYDKQQINYKPIKDQINSEIKQRLKELKEK